ncbi:MAG: N-acetyltransferase [Coriobacteriia bacterium]|nr:N-acetyltransferase [Coriobacteriia bacterium]
MTFEGTVRPERAGDAAAIRRVHAASFPSVGEASLVGSLRDAGDLTVSLVAVVDDEVVGHIAFSPVRTGGGDVGLGLAPIAVLPENRRQGVASALIVAGLAACVTAGYGWVVVLGDPKFYARFGFSAAAEFGLEDEYGGGSAFQAIELISGALPRRAGRVGYGPQFAAL